MTIRRLKKPVKAAPKKVIAKKPVQSRYKEDEGFREKRKADSRASYRKNTANFESVSPLRSLDYYATLAEQLPVEYNGRTFTTSCIKVTALADLLQTSYQSLWRSLTAGSIPSPVLVTRMGKRELLVYTQDEVRVIITIIGEHKRQFSYYRKDHHHTRKRLFDEVTKIRNQWDTSWPANPDARLPRKPPQPKKPLPLKRKKP